MKAITTYLKGIEPYLVAQVTELGSKEQSEENDKEFIFVKQLLKEIAELPAIEQGE